MYFHVAELQKYFQVCSERWVHCVPRFKLIMYVRNAHCARAHTLDAKPIECKTECIQERSVDRRHHHHHRQTVYVRRVWCSVNLVQISFKDLPFFIKSSLRWLLKCVLLTEQRARARTRTLSTESASRNNSGQIKTKCERASTMKTRWWWTPKEKKNTPEKLYSTRTLQWTP